MIHARRAYTIVEVFSLHELLDKLINHTWCGCNGFRYENTVWLNDAFSADGAQEYAVFRCPRGADPHAIEELEQIESITVSWCSRDQLTKIVERLTSEEPQEVYKRHKIRKHGEEPCMLCA